jgi:hypothetical protein
MTKWRKKWRRFRPQRTTEPQQVSARGPYKGVFTEAWQIIDQVTHQYDVRAYNGIDQLEQEIEARKSRAHTAADWLALVLLQTPRAARAQAQMDAHKSNYHNRQERLFELIDYNDSFVNTVLALPKNELVDFAERLRKASHELCRRLQTPNFSDEQFDAIVRGLSREIAVYRAALTLGYSARMTSRVEDAFGIDMVLEDQWGRVLNIDVKTPSAFRHRMTDLVHEGRITEDELYAADERDFLIHIHKHHGTRVESVPVVLLCVRPESLGDIVNFEFEDPEKLGTLLATIAKEREYKYE